MAMHNTDRDFYGKQTDERILYVVRPHPLSFVLHLAEIYTIAVAVFIVFFVLGKIVEPEVGVLDLAGIAISLLIFVLGTKIVSNSQSRNISYITDRRIVRFEPTTLFATNARSLTWDEAVKVKTYPPNFIWKQLAIGNVTVHARTSIRTADDIPTGTVTADDVELKDVFYYRDLGNYIDKILFTYKQKPTDVAQIHPFVPKPRGQRY